MSYRVQFLSPETKLSQELAAGAVNSSAKLRARQIAHYKLTANRVMLAGLSCDWILIDLKLLLLGG